MIVNEMGRIRIPEHTNPAVHGFCPDSQEHRSVLASPHHAFNQPARVVSGVSTGHGFIVTHLPSSFVTSSQSLAIPNLPHFVTPKHRPRGRLLILYHEIERVNMTRTITLPTAIPAIDANPLRSATNGKKERCRGPYQYLSSSSRTLSQRYVAGLAANFINDD